MKCPECKKEIETVRIYSECWQYGSVSKDGELNDYSSMEEILETHLILHDLCSADVSKVVRET